MKLEQYREQLKRSLWLLRAVVLVFFCMGGVVWTRSDSYAAGMLCGMATGGCLMSLPVLIRYSRALKDDKLLMRLYNAKHDERMQAIRARAGLPMTLYMALGMMLAAMIAAPFNETVMFTLVAAAIVQLLASCMTKWICMRTM